MMHLLRTIQSWFSRRTFHVSAILLVAVIMVGLLVPGTSHALNGIGGILLQVLSWIVSGIVFVLGRLITSVIEYIIVVAQYNNFINSTAVTVGWTVLRDMANMVVIVLLLLIAVGTILKSEHYEYSHMLPRLLTMAVLVNFSKTITGFLIDVSQIVMLTFVAAFAEGGAGNFVTALGLEKMLSVSPDTVGDVGFLEVFAGIMLALVLMIIALTVLVSMLVILSFRIVMLWILTVTSPIVFIASAVEAGHHYYADWWKKLTNYLIVGPALAFFIWLTLVAAGGTPGSDSRIVRDFGGDGKTSYFATAEQQRFITTIGRRDNMIAFLIAIAMLIGGIHIASELGVMGSGFAEKGLEKIKGVGESILHGGQHLAGKAAAMPFKLSGTWAKRKWNETMPAWMNPAAMYHAYQERREELAGAAHGKAGARAKEFVEKTMTTRLNLKKLKEGKMPISIGYTMPYEDTYEAGLEEEMVHKFAALDKEEKGHIMKSLWDKKGAEAERAKRGLLMAAAAEGHLDDVLGIEYFRKEAKWTDDDGVEHTGFQEADGTFYNREILLNFLRASVGNGDTKKASKSEQGMRAIAELGVTGRKIAHYEYDGFTGVDEKTGKWKFRDQDSNGLIKKSGEERVHADGTKSKGLVTDDADGYVRNEMDKKGARDNLKNHPHNAGALRMKTEGGKEVGADWAGRTTAFEDMNMGRDFLAPVERDSQEFKRSFQGRNAGLFTSYNSKDGIFTVADKMAETRLKMVIDINPAGAKAALSEIFAKMGGKGIYDKAAGKTYINFDDYAVQKGWWPPTAPPASGASGPKGSPPGGPTPPPAGGGGVAGGGGGGGGGGPQLTADDIRTAFETADLSRAFSKIKFPKQQAIDMKPLADQMKRVVDVLKDIKKKTK